MLTKKRFLVLFLIAFCCFQGTYLYGQKVSKPDSLWFAEMASKINKSINENPKRADSLARIYFARAKALKNNEYIGKGACLVHMGVSLLGSASAKAWYDTATVYLQRSKNYLWNGYLNMNAGNIHNRKYSFESGIQYLIKSISYFEQAKDTAQLAMAYSGISNAFHDFGNYEKGKEYARKGLKIAQSQKEPSARIQWWLINVLGINYDDNKEYDQAIATHLKAMALVKDNDYLLASTYNNLGNSYKKKGMLANAEKYLDKSFEKAKILKNDYHYATVYGNLGDVALKQKKYALSRKYLDSCLYYSEKTASPEKLKDAYEYNAAWYEATGDDKQSLKFVREFIKLKDSLENEAKAGIIYDAQERYESVKKEKENRQLQLSNALKTTERNNAIFEKKLILFSSVVLIVLLLIVGYLLYRIKLGHFKRNEDLKMNQALFTGEQNERIRIARDLHDGVGQMLSLVKMNLSVVPLPDAQLQQSINLLDDTIEEVRNISHNLIPEDLNFGLYAALETLADKVNKAGPTQMQVNISEQVRKQSLKKENELSVYRIIQEVVSNMIRHAEASHIELNAVQQEQKIIFSISDNGKGIDSQSIENTKGIGWKNIKARINLMDGELKVHSERLSGTKIEISLSLQK